MKKLIFVLALAVALLNTAPARADASDNGCKNSNNKAAGCDDGKGDKGDKDGKDGKGWYDNGWKDGKKDDPTNMPEPSSILLLASGILALGGFTLASRKRNFQR